MILALLRFMRVRPSTLVVAESSSEGAGSGFLVAAEENAEALVRRSLGVGAVERLELLEKASKLAVREYSSAVRDFCLKRFGGDEWAGDEAAHRTFIAMWTALPRFRGESTLLVFILGCAKFVCLEVARELKRALSLLEGNEDGILDGLDTSENGAEEWVLREERREAIASVFRKLDRRSQWLLLQRFAEERSYQQILPDFRMKFDQSITTEGGLRAAVSQALGKLERHLRRSDVDR